MRTITVGDIHGSTLWKNINPEEYDKIIFVGDYTDHWTYTDAHILNNLKDIIVFKETNPDKVELLLGNHDMQYMFENYSLHSCSGFRPSMSVALHELFTEKKILFRAAYYAENEEGIKFLWTHGGVSEPWYVRRFVPVIEKMGIENENLGDQLNLAFDAYMPELFDVGFDRYGRQPYGGPFWADRREVQWEPLPNLTQIIGHTKLPKIKSFIKGEDKTDLTFVDVLEGDNPEFYDLTI